MIVPKEEIPDGDVVNRLIDFPHKYSNARELIWDAVFEFPGGMHESVVWSRFAPTDEDVHAIGRGNAVAKQARKPDCRYIGFIRLVAGAVRAIETRAGHRFSVEHHPEDDRPSHAAIEYRFANGANYRAVSKPEIYDLKFAIKHACSPLEPDSAAQPE